MVSSCLLAETHRSQSTFAVSASVDAARATATAVRLTRLYWVLMAFMGAARPCYIHWRMQWIQVNLLCLCMWSYVLGLAIMRQTLIQTLGWGAVVFVRWLFSGLGQDLFSFLLLGVHVPMEFTSAVTVMNQFFQIFILTILLKLELSLAQAPRTVQAYPNLVKFIKTLQTLIALHILLIL